MNERSDTAPQGVQETSTAWESPAVLHARPVPQPIDWDAILDEIEHDFPKTLARLAE